MKRVFVTASVLALCSILGPEFPPGLGRGKGCKRHRGHGGRAGRFKTLVTAVKAADLVETLKGKGPFTVFAPYR